MNSADSKKYKKSAKYTILLIEVCACLQYISLSAALVKDVKSEI